jgi:hypothetical protein
MYTLAYLPKLTKKLAALLTEMLRPAFKAGLPDGIFSNQKSQFDYILRASDWKFLVNNYGRSEYWIIIWNILWPFGLFCGLLIYFIPFRYVVPR